MTSTQSQSSLLPEGNPATAPITPVLTITDGKPTCLSTDVAQHFNKRHDNVIQAIESLLPQLPADHLLNFQETTIQVAITGAANAQGSTRESKAYRLSKDGFTLLAFGFTGKRALRFKMAYIEAFNQMEAQLLDGTPARTPYSVTPKQTLSAEEADTLRQVLKTAVEQLPKAQQGAAMIAGWSKLKSHFKVPYREIPRSDSHVLGITLKATTPIPGS